MKRVAIVPTLRKEQDAQYTAQTIAEFLRQGASVWMDTRYAKEYAGENVYFADAEDVYKNCDLIVVLGGDGSILRAAQAALRYDVPLFGINLGRLGYMAEIEKNELSLIERIYTGKYSIEKRMLLSVGILQADGTLLKIGDALNDVAVGRGGYSHTIDIHLLADGRSVRTMRSDGVVICTPTGSTAYSMSAGGSVLDPTLECICVTPVCPLSRYACPIVFSGNSTIEILHDDERSAQWNLVVDGEEERPLYIGEKLVITKSEKMVKMLSVKDEGFFETLNQKISKYELKN